MVCGEVYEPWRVRQNYLQHSSAAKVSFGQEESLSSSPSGFSPPRTKPETRPEEREFTKIAPGIRIEIDSYNYNAPFAPCASSLRAKLRFYTWIFIQLTSFAGLFFMKECVLRLSSFFRSVFEAGSLPAREHESNSLRSGADWSYMIFYTTGRAWVPPLKHVRSCIAGAVMSSKVAPSSGSWIYRENWYILEVMHPERHREAQCGRPPHSAISPPSNLNKDDLLGEWIE